MRYEYEVVWHSTEDGSLEDYLNRHGRKSLYENYEVVSVMYIGVRKVDQRHTPDVRDYQIVFKVTEKTKEELQNAA